MTDEELSELLGSRGVAVVHFSHFASMRGDLAFPDDLLGAIGNKDDWPLSCCALSPGVPMDLPGAVGVLFAPTVASIQSVSNRDSGSFFLGGQENSAGDANISVETVLGSLDPGFQPYNEWRVQGAPVRGIFVANPNFIEAKKKRTLQFPYGPETVVAAEPLSLSEVFAAFPGLPVYTMGPSGLLELACPQHPSTQESENDG